MNTLKICNYEFIKYDLAKAHIYFSTAKGGLDFNKNHQEGLKNLNNIKTWFGVEDVAFLNQIHSNKVYVYDGLIHEADAIITHKSKVALGIFTADCVPIILYDSITNTIAAVHSGWRGTYDNIVSKAIDTMKRKFNTKGKDIHAYIGPHNMQCCYEVNEDLKVQFLSKEIFKDKEIFHGRNLNLQKCIELQLLLEQVPFENIVKTQVCTYCNEDIKMHSYRKNKDQAGRMFSFIYLED